MIDIESGNAAIALSLALATLISEDAACVAAGVLVADGRLSFAAASLACFAGITAGDLLVFAAGRAVGPRILSWPIVQRRVGPAVLKRSAEWLQRRGPVVVLISRFTPGARLATYLAAGILETDARLFAIWFAVASAIWTPLLVGVSALMGAQVGEAFTAAGTRWGVPTLVTAAAMLAVLHLARSLHKPSVRRRLYGAWRRLTRWEFWPLWAFYPPIVIYIVFLMLWYRSATLFTAANPAIPGGGFVGESKFEILQRLGGNPESVARAVLVSAEPERRVHAAKEFIAYSELEFPIVVKPDRGQRGSGVHIVRSLDELRARVAASGDLIVQEYVAGLEYGVFYYRYPAESRGRILSITEKRFPVLRGDGRSTVDELILNDDRAVCQLTVHRRAHKAKLAMVPEAGETVPLVEIGSHCRGALFLDATHLVTPSLAEAFDRIAKQFPGFNFGRFDVRVKSVEAFQAGHDFRIVELNGVTSEATHIYDPANGLLTAYRALLEQWRIAFAIAAQNQARGTRPTPLADLVKSVVDYWRTSRHRSTAAVTASAAAASNGLGVGA